MGFLWPNCGIGKNSGAKMGSPILEYRAKKAYNVVLQVLDEFISAMIQFIRVNLMIL